MNKDDQQLLSGALQENILTLLCFDDSVCKMIRAAVTPHLFASSVFREVAGHAIDFIDQYGEAIKDHLPDHMEGILRGDDERKAKTYRKLLDNLFLSRDNINADYVVSQLNKFVRVQRFKSGLVEAVEAIESNDDIDRAETIMEKAMNSQVVSFEPGTRLDSAEDVGAILDSPEEEGFLLNIPEFDRRGIIPRRKEIFGFIAPRGKGKSWFAVHCAKQALLQRWSVLIITLELSEKRYSARVLQSFFAIGRRDAHTRVTRLERDDDGALKDITQEVIERMTMKDPDIKEVLKKKAKREFHRRKPIRIKSFASGTLKMNTLRAYIDGLKRHENFHPDLIVVDYPRLFDLDSKNLRIELGKVNVDLRGLAHEMNSACVILAQGNRESETAVTVTKDMVEEDISFAATVDIAVTYSQTKGEKAFNLARLLADKVRNEESGITTLITQAYNIGQFCLDSVPMISDYWDFFKEKREEKKDARPVARRRRERVRDAD